MDAVNGSGHVLLIVHVCSFWMEDLVGTKHVISTATRSAPWLVLRSLTVGNPSAVKAFLQWLMLSV